MSLPRHRFPRPVIRAFTLVEMLVVISVILVIFGFSTPALKNLLGGRAVEKSINTVTGVLELGRASAIANHTYVFVLFSNSTNADNNAELKCAVVMSLNGLNTFDNLANLRPVGGLTTVTGIKNIKFSDMPKAVKDVTPKDLQVDSSYVATYNDAQGSSTFPDLVIAGYHFKGAAFIRFDGDGEIGASGDTYSLLVEPVVCLGLAKTVGPNVQTSATDGAIVACYGGTAKLSISRP